MTRREYELPGRLTVGQMFLGHLVGVRILPGQPSLSE